MSEGDPFSRPCSDLVAPLLSDYGRHGSCDAWEVGCLLSLLSMRWRAAITEWRSIVTHVCLDSRATSGALWAVAQAGHNLCVLDLSGCRLSTVTLGAALVRTSRCTQNLRELRLCNCDFHKDRGAEGESIFDFDWTLHWKRLQVLDLQGDILLKDRDVATLLTRQSDLLTLNLSGAEVASYALLGLLVEGVRGQLRTLHLNEVHSCLVPDTFVRTSLAHSIARCTMLRELHLQDLEIMGLHLRHVLEECRQLAVLNLHGTLVTSELLPYIMGLPALTHLCVADTELERELAQGAAADRWPKITSALRRGWGRLRFPRTRAADADVPWLGPELPNGECNVVAGCDYIVGRSRTSSLCIGKNWLHNFVSKLHCRLFMWIVWTDPSAPEPTIVQPWLRDMSQNGTYLNDVLVGNGKCARVCDQDRIKFYCPTAEKVLRSAWGEIELPCGVWETTQPPREAE